MLLEGRSEGGRVDVVVDVDVSSFRLVGTLRELVWYEMTVMFKCLSTYFVRI